MNTRLIVLLIGLFAAASGATWLLTYDFSGPAEARATTGSGAAYEPQAAPETVPAVALSPELAPVIEEQKPVEMAALTPTPAPAELVASETVVAPVAKTVVEAAPAEQSPTIETIEPTAIPETTEATTQQVTEPQAAVQRVSEPQVTAPQVAAPQVAAPQGTAPQVAAPQVAAPQVAAPQVAAPRPSMIETIKDTVAQIPGVEVISAEPTDVAKAELSPPLEPIAEPATIETATQASELAAPSSEPRPAPAPQVAAAQDLLAPASPRNTTVNLDTADDIAFAQSTLEAFGADGGSSDFNFDMFADILTPEAAKPDQQAGSSVFDVVKPSADGRILIAGTSQSDKPLMLLLDGEPYQRIEINAFGQWTTTVPANRAGGQQSFAIAEMELESNQVIRPYLAETAIFLDTSNMMASIAPQTPIAPSAQPEISANAGTGPAIDAGSDSAIDTDTGSIPAVIALPSAGSASLTPGSAPADGGRLVVTQSQGDATFRILEGKLEGPTRFGDLALERLTYDTFGNIQMQGLAKPNQTINLYLNNEPVADVQADASGAWAFEPAALQTAPGKHLVRADMMGENGDVAARIQVPFERQATVWDTDGKVNFKIRRNDNLWQIASRAFGDGIKYTLIYRNNRSQIANPNLIFPDQVFTISKNTDQPE